MWQRYGLASRLIDSTMPKPAFEGIQILCPFTLDEFEITQARTIRKLVEHAYRNQLMHR